MSRSYSETDCKVGNGNSIAVIASKEEVKSGTVLGSIRSLI